MVTARRTHITTFIADRMSDSRFAVLMLIIIVILLIPVALHRCEVCEQKGGIYCKLGPRRGW
jgi:hypothetical protein